MPIMCMPGRLLLVASCLSTAACGAAPDRGDPVASSAAVGALPERELAALACTPLFRPTDSLPPQVAIGAVSERGVMAWQPLGMPMLVLRHPDGHEVRIDGLGDRTRFLAVARLGWVGDTLTLTDGESNRLHRFLPDGTVLGTVLAPAIRSWAAPDPTSLIAIAPRGFAAGVADSAWTLIRARPGQARVDSIARVASPPWQMIRLPGGMDLHPLSVLTLAGLSANGTRWCATRVGDDGMHLRCETTAGELLFDRLLSVPHRALSDELYGRIVMQYATPEANHPDSLRAAVPRTDSLPFAFPPLLVGRDGAVWLLRTHPLEEGTVWLRVDPDGTPRDLLTLPRHAMPIDFTADTFWLTIPDAAQIHQVSRCAVAS